MADRQELNVHREDDAQGRLRRIAAQFGQGNGVELVVQNGVLQLSLRAGGNTVTIPLEEPNADFARIVQHLQTNLPAPKPPAS